MIFVFYLCFFDSVRFQYSSRLVIFFSFQGWWYFSDLAVLFLQSFLFSRFSLSTWHFFHAKCPSCIWVYILIGCIRVSGLIFFHFGKYLDIIHVNKEDSLQVFHTSVCSLTFSRGWVTASVFIFSGLFLGILAGSYNIMVRMIWMVSIVLQDSNTSILLLKHLGNARSTLIYIYTSVTFMFHTLSLVFRPWNWVIRLYLEVQENYMFLIFLDIFWFVHIIFNSMVVYVLFFRTDFRLCIYNYNFHYPLTPCEFFSSALVGVFTGFSMIANFVSWILLSILASFKNAAV